MNQSNQQEASAAELELAMALAERKRADAALFSENSEANPSVDQIIKIYTRLADLFEKGGHCLELGKTMVQLSIALVKRKTGLPQENGEIALQHAMKAAAIFERLEDRFQWARAMGNLGLIHTRFFLNQKPNRHLAESCYLAALSVFTQEAYPEEWARAKTSLGNLMMHDLEDPVSRKSAIGFFREALRVRTQTKMPRIYAQINCSLGRLYGLSVKSISDLARSAISYERALRVFSGESHTRERLNVLTWQAEVFQRLGLSASCDYRDLAHKKFLEARQLVDPASDSSRWASLTEKASGCLEDLVHGNTGQNIRAALILQCSAVERRIRVENPVHWAASHLSLGRLYFRQSIGNRGDHLAAALAAIKQAEEVFTSTAFPEDWSTVQHYLAAIYQEAEGDFRTFDLDKAFIAYRNALHIRTPENHPRLWAETLNNMAVALRTQAERGNIESMAAAQVLILGVLKDISAEQFPEIWANLNTNLATILLFLANHDPVENLEAAIAACNRALQILDKKTHPTQWAACQTILANCYRTRLEGANQDNLQKAIHYFSRSLEIYTADSFRTQWLSTMVNLCGTWQEIGHPKTDTSIEVAISYGYKALTILGSADNRGLRSALMVNLGSAYMKRTLGSRRIQIERGIACYEQALSLRPRANPTPKRSQLLINLATAYWTRGRGSKHENLRLALAYATEASNFYRRAKIFSGYREAQELIGNIYFQLQNWRQARSVYLKAWKAGESAIRAAHTESGRLVTYTESYVLSSRMAYCSMKLNEWLRAIQCQETGQARDLKRALFWQRAEAEMDPVAYERGRNLYGVIKRLEAEMHLPLKHELLREMARKLEPLQEQLESLWSELASPPQGAPFTASDLAKIARGHVVVMPILSTAGGLVLVIPGGTSKLSKKHVLTLENFDINTLAELIDPYQMGARGWLRWQVMANNQAERMVMWKRVVGDCLARLSVDFVAPICKRLKDLKVADGAKLTFIPRGAMSILPLHAATNEEGERLIEHYQVHYAPSLKVFLNGHSKKEPTENLTHILACLDPKHDLGNADMEAELFRRMGDHKNLSVIKGEEVTWEKIEAELPKHQICHFSGHGFFHHENSWLSGLVTASGVYTRARMSGYLNLSDCRLMVLSACETGISDVLVAPEEWLGLPVEFLKAGARAVLGSLWKVDNTATSIFLETFYHQLLKENHSPGQSLRAAQLWLSDVTNGELRQHYREVLKGVNRSSNPGLTKKLRGMVNRFSMAIADERPFKEPYFWAGFSLTGY